MPIIAIEEDSLRQRCALCETERLLTLDELPPHEAIPEGMLVLPACGCGAVEHLIQAPAGEPEHPEPGSFGHLHRLLVEALVEEARAPKQRAARVDRALRSRIEARIPSAQRERWFSNGLRSEAAAGEERGS